MKLEITLNGEAAALQIAPGARLLDALRDHGLVGTKEGCREGSCGACAVIVDGRPVASCIMFAALAQGRTVETVEGLGTVDDLHPLQRALVEESGVQCGYCTPGMLMSAKALLDSNPDPTEAEVAAALDGNLCRCTGYVKIIQGVMRAARDLSGDRR